MDAMFQIGKEIGEIRSRLEKLEKDEDCDCQSRRGGELKESELTDHQRRVLTFLRRNHKKVFEALNQALASDLIGLEAAVGEKLYFGSVKFMSAERHEQLLSSDYPIECCICCPDGNYCCDFAGCSYCAHDCAR